MLVKTREIELQNNCEGLRRDSRFCGRLTAGRSIDLMNIEKTMEFIVSNLADLTVKQAELTVKQARTDRQIHGLHCRWAAAS